MYIKDGGTVGWPCMWKLLQMRRQKDVTGMKHCPLKIELETFTNEMEIYQRHEALYIED
jgi:hypothetical protein